MVDKKERDISKLISDKVLTLIKILNQEAKDVHAHNFMPKVIVFVKDRIIGEYLKKLLKMLDKERKHC